MSSLHLLSKPWPHKAAQACIQAVSEGDSLLLLGEALLGDAVVFDEQASDKNITLYARAAEAKAIGTGLIKFPGTLIDDDEFVGLTETHHPIVSWY